MTAVDRVPAITPPNNVRRFIAGVLRFAGLAARRGVSHRGHFEASRCFYVRCWLGCFDRRVGDRPNRNAVRGESEPPVKRIVD